MPRDASHNMLVPPHGSDLAATASTAIAFSGNEGSTQPNAQGGVGTLNSVERVTIMGNAVPIRALIYQEGDFIIAQCLEYDLGAYAMDIETLKARLDAVIDMECETSVEMFGEPFKGIPPAPKRFFSRWEDGYEMEGSTDPSHFMNDGLEVEVSYKLAA